MSDQQSTSWRDRFFGTAPLAEATPDERGGAPADADVDASEVSAAHSAELAPDSTEAATTTVDEHDEHQPLVEHEPEADTAVLERPAASDSPIEPTVIAPSSLRGPSHSAAHPDDAARPSAEQVHGEAASSSLESEPVAEPTEPPALVEPRRPSFGLRRHGDAEAPGASLSGLTGASVAAGAASGDRDREFVEPEPTQAIDAQRRDDDDATRAMDTVGDDRDADATDDAPTRTMDAQADEPTQSLQQPLRDRSNRFGIVRDDVRDEVPDSAIGGDATTTGAGAPIVLVEEPVPPRRKGARGVGVAVVLLATLVFALLHAAAFFAVGYLFDRQFDAAETLQSLWLRPSYLLPVVVFFVGYLLLSLIANRAGWWAHVLGGFVVALLAYAAHIAGAYMEAEGGWGSFAAVPGIDAASLGQLLLAPLSVLAFVLAREVPIWVGGIQSRRGRRARERNRQAMDEFNSENAERLAAYERARG